MLADPKVIPKSRIPYVSNESADRINKIMSELSEKGIINPERTSTGRVYISPSEFEAVRMRLEAT